MRIRLQVNCIAFCYTMRENRFRLHIISYFFFPPFRPNAVKYADKLKWNASSIIFKFINMTKGLQFRWCSNKTIITLVSVTYLHIILLFFFLRLIYSEDICKMHRTYTFTPWIHLRSTKILIRRRNINVTHLCYSRNCNQVCANINS